MKSDWEAIARERDAYVLSRPHSGKRFRNAVDVLTWFRIEFNVYGDPGEGANSYDLVQLDENRTTLTCGSRDEGTWLRRANGVECQFRLDFQLGKDATGKPRMELAGYAMSLRVAESMNAPAFLRWEFSPTRMTDVTAVKEPLCHLHPGHQHVRLPTPKHTFEELIQLFMTMEPW